MSKAKIEGLDDNTVRQCERLLEELLKEINQDTTKLVGEFAEKHGWSKTQVYRYLGFRYNYGVADGITKCINLLEKLEDRRLSLAVEVVK